MVCRQLISDIPEDCEIMSPATYQGVSNVKPSLSRIKTMFRNDNGFDFESLCDKTWLIFPCKVKR